jgi:hypothetical protein
MQTSFEQTCEMPSQQKHERVEQHEVCDVHVVQIARPMPERACIAAGHLPVAGDDQSMPSWGSSGAVGPFSSPCSATLSWISAARRRARVCGQNRSNHHVSAVNGLGSERLPSWTR